MKKIIIALLLVTLLIGLVPIGASLAETYSTVYSGNKFGVRMRSGPGTNYENVVTLSSGTTVIVLEQGAVWTRIQAGTSIGYMMSRFLVGGGNGGNITYENTGFVYAGNGSRTWLRSAPNGKRLGLYADNTPLKIITYDDDWSKVMVGSSVGYMSTKFISIDKPQPTPSPAPTVISNMRINYPYPLVGDTLTAVLTPANATVSYLWERRNTADDTYTVISYGDTYSVSRSDLNQQIRLTVTGTGNYTGVTMSFTTELVTNEKTISSVSIYNANNTHDVPVVGDVLGAVIAPSSANATYSWRVAGTQKSTASTYTVEALDVGKQIQLSIVGSEPFTGRATSLSTKAVISANTISSVKLSTTSPVVGSALSAVTVPAGLSVSYIWYVDDVQVSTDATYTPIAANLGHEITVKVTGTGTSTGMAISAPSSPVAQAVLTGLAVNVTAPAVGSTLFAAVSPGDATALYEWYCEGVRDKISDGPYYTVEQEYSGKKLYAKAIGTGIFGGSVTSAKTAPVARFVQLTGVTLNNTSPVVGDKITASLQPATAVNSGNNIFIWYVNGVAVTSNTSNTYVVSSEDKDCRISVRVNGGGSNTGSVSSADTNPVTAVYKLTSAEIFNTHTNGYVNDGTVYIGQTLRVDSKPNIDNSSFKKYFWFRDDGVPLSEARTCTVRPDDMGHKITVTIRDNRAPNEAKSRSVTVAKTKGVGTIDLSNIVPKTGRSPVTSIKTDTYSAKLAWHPAMDQYGHFVNGVEYTAVVTFSLPAGCTLPQSTTNYGGEAVKEEKSLNVLKATFPKVAGDQYVTVFYINGLDAPVINKAPDTDINLTSQFEGVSVKWLNEDGTPLDVSEGFKIGKVYKAQIEIKTTGGYMFSPDQQQLQGKPLFTVSGAQNATCNVTSPTTAVITAVYDTTVSGTTAHVTASRTEVPAGYSNKYVQCAATLMNYDGSQSNLSWEWSVSRNTRPGTTIDRNGGTLTIDWGEPAGTNLLVTAVLGADSRYSASIEIKLVAATTPGGNITVEYVQAPDRIAHSRDNDKTFRYVATVKNATDEGVHWEMTGNKADGTKLSPDGTLTLSKNETASSLRIVAYAKADPTKTAPLDVTIVYPDVEKNVKIAFTQSKGTMEPGEKCTFEAQLTNGLTTSRIKFMAGDQVTITDDPKQTGNGTYTCDVKINDNAKDGDTVSLKAVYHNGTLGVTVAPAEVTIGIVDSSTVARDVTIDGPDTINSKARSIAIAQFTATDDNQQDVTESVTWAVSGAVTDSSTSINANGELTIGANETATSLTITANSEEHPISLKYSAADSVTQPLSNSSTYAGGALTLAASFDSGVPGKWESSDTNVATVDENGAVHGKSAGEATITAISSVDSSVTTTATVTVAASAITLSEAPGSIEFGSSAQFAAAVSFLSDTTVTWSVSGATDANTTVDSAGVLTIGANETAFELTVTATCNGNEKQSASNSVTVTYPPITMPSVSQETIKLVIGATKTLDCKASRGGVTWASSKPEVATCIDGVVTAVTAGKTVITATSILDDQQSVKFTFEVTNKSQNGDGASKPEDGTAQPEDGTSNPGDGASQPGDGTAQSGDGTSNPGDGASNPEDGTSQSGDGTSNPEDGASSQPGNVIPALPDGMTPINPEA